MRVHIKRACFATPASPHITLGGTYYCIVLLRTLSSVRNLVLGTWYGDRHEFRDRAPTADRVLLLDELAMMLYDPMDFANEVHFKKGYIPWCTSLKIRTHTPHPQHPPLFESTQNLHKPQNPSTGHPISFALVRVRFGGGGRRQAPRPKPPYLYTSMYPLLYTWYQAFGYNKTIHRRL